MATGKVERAETGREPRLELLVGGGVPLYRAMWPTKVYRYLLSNGGVVDVETTAEDSDLRGALVRWAKADIVGVTELREDGQ